MSLIYKGIKLDLPAGKVSMSHSRAMDMIRGESSTQNMDWVDTLGGLPWGTLKDVCPDAYVHAGELFSLIHMDYQVCNGGIVQYFYNYYDEERAACHADDVERYGLDDQKRAFLELAQFGRELFPDRQVENEALQRTAEAFQNLYCERDALLYETVSCEEDEYIYDEELGEEVENPDYFEDYEEPYREDVIHGDDNFDGIHYHAIEYIEELFELSAQYQCKALARDIDRYNAEHPEVAKALHEHLPEAAFRKPSFASRLANAASRTDGAGKAAPQREISPEH